MPLGSECANSARVQICIKMTSVAAKNQVGAIGAGTMSSPSRFLLILNLRSQPVDKSRPKFNFNFSIPPERANSTKKPKR
ncbi:MAG: hypothetical protein C5B49_05195 [Bdellovibrio sp.]|nr:MAG: hypothetical protein C5B49_05195 [Bdellovibrio sp.]